ncbi:unnamed protein product [marine sediment metagenome]|uniref:HTH arsR-type domain-containing protein n=1 Tax=marine sediment metagenome TaxID=412755 RepID=X0ZQV7_9ZZZZ
MIQQTSLIAFNDILPDLGKKQQQIYDLFEKKGELYDQKIAKILNLPINCITPRRNELEKAKLIYKSGYCYSEYTNKKVNKYKIIKR